MPDPKPPAPSTPPTLEIRPIIGIGDVTLGADLAALITGAAPWLANGDVLVVTSKIVSKAEGRTVEVPVDGPERDAARDAVLAAETARTVASRGPTHIVVTHHGFVLAAAGIDASNVERSRLVLLPADPDASARSLRAALRQRYGLDVAVIITDTMGRPWRLGLVDTAIGAAGVDALADYRGALDPYGNELRLTQMAVIDELAGAAELVKGKCDQVPVAVVRGLPRLSDVDGAGAVALVRDAEQDMFSLGTTEARALGRHDAATLADATGFAERMVDPEVVGRALAAVGAAFVRVTDAGVRDKLCAALPTMPAGPAEVVVPGLDNRSGGDPDRWAGAQVGATVHRLRAELAAAGLATAWLRADPDTVADIVALPDGYAPLGVLAVGTASG
jgi:coenzyme F420-0:L-glutamate ligase/coenzyme F420-1:gamma-L-glutamate ligase